MASGTSRRIESCPDRDAIYDVLVAECGAYDSEDRRREFAHHFPVCREFRFQGRLGFGGKVWWNPSFGRPPLYVNCYREDETPQLRRIIGAANDRLAELCAVASGGSGATPNQGETP